MKHVVAFLLAALVVFPLTGQTKIPRQERDRIIYDYADVLDADAEQAIQKITWPLVQVKRPIIIITVQSLADYGSAPEHIIRYASQIYNQWEIGSRTSGNMGALILISKGDKKIAIEVGEGVTRNRSDQLDSIINDVITPNFKENDYAGGLLEGVVAIRDRVFQPTTEIDLRNIPVEGAPAPPRNPTPTETPSGDLGLPGPSDSPGREFPSPSPGPEGAPRPQSGPSVPGFDMNFDCGRWFCFAVGILLLISMFRRRKPRGYGYGGYGGPAGGPPPGYGYQRYGGGGLGGMLGGLLTGMLMSGMNRRNRGGGGGIFGGGGGMPRSSGGGGSVFGGGASSGGGGGGGGFGAAFGGGTASGRGASGSW